MPKASIEAGELKPSSATYGRTLPFMSTRRPASSTTLASEMKMEQWKKIKKFKQKSSQQMIIENERNATCSCAWALLRLPREERLKNANVFC